MHQNNPDNFPEKQHEQNDLKGPHISNKNTEIQPQQKVSEKYIPHRDKAELLTSCDTSQT